MLQRGIMVRQEGKLEDDRYRGMSQLEDGVKAGMSKLEDVVNSAILGRMDGMKLEISELNSKMSKICRFQDVLVHCNSQVGFHLHWMVDVTNQWILFTLICDI